MELGFGEIAVILVVVLLLFGPSKLPGLGEALGKGIREFKKAASGNGASEEPPPLERGEPRSASLEPSAEPAKKPA